MLKLRSIVSFLLLIMLLPYPGNASASTLSPIFGTGNNLNADSHFVVVKVNEITFLDSTGDVTGDGEFRLLMLGADTKGHSSGVFCPSDKPIAVRQGQTVKDFCLSGLDFEENKVSDSVVIMIMALDEDKSTAATDLPYEAAVGGLSTALGKAVASYAPKLDPYTFTMQVLLSFATAKVKDWVEKSDTIGSHTLHLQKADHWSATGKPKTIKSSDGGIELTYTITRSTSVPPGGVTKTPRPQNIPTKTPVSISTRPSQPTPVLNADTGTISCADRIYYARLRQTPGYKSKDDIADTVAQVPCGETIQILDGPTGKDNLNWWHVSWNGQTGWIADHTSTGKVLIIFD